MSIKRQFNNPKQDRRHSTNIFCLYIKKYCTFAVGNLSQIIAFFVTRLNENLYANDRETNT